MQQRQHELGSALEQDDWDRALGLVERAPLPRIERNLIKSAVLHEKGRHELDGRNWNQARLAFIEARRLSGNPEFWYDEALAYRGFGNRKVERETYKKYLELIPDGRHAQDARRRLRRIAKKRIVRPRHDEQAKREAAQRDAERRKKPQLLPKAPPGIRTPPALANPPPAPPKPSESDAAPAL